MSIQPSTRNVLGPVMQEAIGFTGFSPSLLFAAGENGVWYDPSDLSTLWTTSAQTTQVTTDGDKVGYMADKSGNGFDLTQPTAGSRPTYRRGAGLHWLAFDALDDNLFISTTSGIGVATSVIAAEPETGLDQWAGLVTNFTFSVPNVEVVFVRLSTQTNWYNDQPVDALANSTHIWQNQVQTINFDLDTLSVFAADGTDGFSDLSLGDGLIIGNDRGIAGRHFKGFFYGLVTNGDTQATILSEANRNLVEEWLAVKAGVTL